MADDQRFEIKIYHNGVHFIAPSRGRKRYLQEKAFLNDLVAPKYGRLPAGLPVPDPTTDYYELDDAELEAYSAFRHAREKSSQVV